MLWFLWGQHIWSYCGRYLYWKQYLYCFCQKKVYLVTLAPKTGKLWNQVQITRQEPCDWPASHRTCFGLRKPGTPGFVYFVAAFNCFWRILSQRPYISARTRIIRRLTVMDWYTATYTYEVSFHFTRTYRLLLIGEMVWIMAGQSPFFLDFSPVRMLMNQMWLLPTSYIATTPVYNSSSVITKTIKALTYISVSYTHLTLPTIYSV